MGTKNNPGAFDCYEAAADDEPMFVLLARDPMAPELVHAWADARQGWVKRLLDSEGRERQMAKIEEARACAKSMREWRDAHECSDRNCRHNGTKHHAGGCDGRTLYGGCDCYGFDPNFDRPASPGHRRPSMLCTLEPGHDGECNGLLYRHPLVRGEGSRPDA